MNESGTQHVFFLVMLTILFVGTTYMVFAERPTLPTVNGVPVEINFGFKSVSSVATPTFDVGATPITLNARLPMDTQGFELRAKTGDFVVGHADDIATGTDRVGRLVLEGETYTWNGLAGTFNGVILSNSGTATVVIDAAWGDW